MDPADGVNPKADVPSGTTRPDTELLPSSCRAGGRDLSRTSCSDDPG